MNQNSLEDLRSKNFMEKPMTSQIDIFEQAFWMLFAFLLSTSNICGEVSPFGVSVCAVASQVASFSATIGSLLGYIIADGDNMLYIISVFLIIVVRWLFEDFKYVKAAVMTFFSILTASFIFMLVARSFNFYNILIYFSESVMASGATFFLQNAKKSIGNKINYKGLSSSELATLLISLIIVLMPLMSFTLKSVSIGKIFAIYTILFVALNMDYSSSTIVGMLIGLTVLISGNEQNGYVIASYGLGGFLAGLSRKYKSIGVTSVFILINGITSVFSSVVSEKSIYVSLLELFIASGLFIVTNKAVRKKVDLVKENNVDIISCENAKNLMLSKLSFASNTLNDIASTTQQLSDQLSKNSRSSVEEIYDKCVKKICSNCNLKMFCWNAAYNDVVNSFNDMTTVLKDNGKVTMEDVSLFMKNKCNNLDEIVSEVNEGYRRFIANKSVDRKVNEIRNVVTDQFDGMADMLKDLANEFYEISQFDGEASIKAKKVLKDVGLRVYSITSFTDKYGRLTIEASTNIVQNIDYVGKAISFRLSDVCEKNFSLPFFVKVNKFMKITIIEKANYDIDFGVTQLSCNNFKYCGDSYNYFVDAKGRAYMILSDGMGTGSRAAVDGAMTTGLLSKLIKAGFDFQAASKIVNAALLVKSNDESLSTIDVTSVDLYTGKINIFKAGAAPTFAKKSDKVLEFECSTLPAGILRGVSFDKKTIYLSHNDVIIMVSDGVTNNKYDWIYDEIKSFKHNITAKELSRKIALESKLRNKSNHDDDVTVMVGVISKGV